MATHEFVVKLMLLDHDGVDHLRILESKEAETTGSTGLTIAHNSALDHLAEL